MAKRLNMRDRQISRGLPGFAAGAFTWACLYAGLTKLGA
jgi:hypothetical protein